MNMPLLEKALKSYGIPQPVHIVQSNGFLRWGRNNRFWAVQVEDGYFFGDYVSDLSTSVFPDKVLSRDEEYVRARKIAEYMERTRQEQESLYQMAQQRANRIWENSSYLTFSHDYLARKKALNMGLKLSGEGALIVPLKDILGEIRTLQFISSDGSKRFLSQGKKAEHFFMFGKPRHLIYLCEGYATASSLYQALNECVVACFDAGNLEKVGIVIAQKYPECELIFCADNDRFREVNIGIEKARAAAKRLKSKLVFPVFDDKDTQSSDFNDLHCWYGLDFVKAQLQGTLEVKK